MKSFQANITIGSIAVHVITWALLTVFTLGLAMFFYPYAFGRVLLNNAYLLDENRKRIGRLKCNVSLTGELGHILLWTIISLLTLGIGAFFYAFKAFGIVLNNTTVEPLS